ncbi:MAG: tail fiber domain-containing protein [Actinomycetota bacterium]|nr:tail fiber domain-containing protein [Actinomycetota bacterium]
MTDESPDRETQAESEPESTYEPPQAEEMPEDKTAGTATGVNGQVNGTLTSDRNLKEHVEPVDADAVLAGVVDLPIRSWSYRGDDPRARHIGPMAQDFAAAFGAGDDDRRIHTVDANGVALISIQALAARLAAAETQIEELQAELDRARDPASV